MAWNEPGGSGGRDPWGGRNDQGPPDLDEVIRKLQGRLGRLFGGKGGGGSGASVGAGGLGLVLIIALLVWAASGIYIVDEGKRAVVLQFGAYQATTAPGPHWHPRFVQSVHIVDVENVRSMEVGYRADEALMLTQDENIIDIKFAVQYQVKEPRDYLFNVRDPDATLRQVVESAVREVVGKSKMDFVITGGRSEIVARARELVQGVLDEYKTGLMLINLTMQDAQAPEQVQHAFADAVKAREDEQRLKNEAEAYANDVLPKARGAAARVLEEAQAYKEQVVAEADGEAARFEKILGEYAKAPSVTRERLYLESLESVLQRSSKVMVDTQGSNLLYLPLDQVVRGGARLGEPQVGAVGQSVLNDAKERQTQRSATDMRTDMRRREVR